MVDGKPHLQEVEVLENLRSCLDPTLVKRSVIHNSPRLLMFCSRQGTDNPDWRCHRRCDGSTDGCAPWTGLHLCDASDIGESRLFQESVNCGTTAETQADLHLEKACPSRVTEISCK